MNRSMTSSDSPPPPPHNPYVSTPSTPPPAGAPAYAMPPTPPRRSGWHWRETVAGVVAGGVLAASVAVPATWALTREAPSPAADAPSAPAPGRDPGLMPEGGNGGSPFGGNASEQSGDWADATAEQSQGVVMIETRTTAGAGAGTGLVLDEEGLVLTNYHVVAGSTQVEVTLASTGVRYTATVLGRDQGADIALLQLDGASDLATVDLDDDGGAAASDEVTAVGNAQGQGFLSAATGSVVALDRSIDTEAEGVLRGEHLTGLIQTDAYVVGGFSGGALLDDEGEVVGVTTAASSGGETESYAVPIDDALAVAEQIQNGEESDGVQIGPSAYLGISVANVGGDTGSGVQVAQVQSDGAAQGAGIQAGAVITDIDDTAITSYDVLHSALAAYEPGDSVVLRWTDAGGTSQSATVTLGESPVN